MGNSFLHCPVCGKLFDPTLSAAMPFCSPRCKRVDLGRWLYEEYSLPEDRIDDEDRQREPWDEE